MPIIDNVNRRSAEVAANAGVGEENQELAIAAILGGIESPAWETYMRQYIDNPAPANDPDLPTRQLMRLLGTDGTGNNVEMRKRRAYLVANAICAQGTGTGLPQNVNTIDNGL